MALPLLSPFKMGPHQQPEGTKGFNYAMKSLGFAPQICPGSSTSALSKDHMEASTSCSQLAGSVANSVGTKDPGYKTKQAMGPLSPIKCHFSPKQSLGKGNKC